MTELELGIVKKLSQASFPPATASKRFAANLAAGYVKELSDSGREFLAYIVNRFRRQYRLNAEERQWVATWLKPRCEAKCDA